MTRTRGRGRWRRERGGEVGHAGICSRLAQIAARPQHSVLLLSAVEFYAFMAFDLADVAGKQMCTLNGHQVVGNTYTQCDSPAILKEFIERV